MRNYPVIVLNAVDTSTQTGSAFFVGQAAAASFIATFGDATAAGTVKVQGSNELPIGEPTRFVPSSTTFADIPNATSAIASGVGPAIVLPTMNFQYIRVVYTSASGGSSTIIIRMSALGV